MLDTDALAGKPVLIGATGGTARHSLALEHALRPLFAYLRAVVVPTAVFAASEDWGAGDGPTAARSRAHRPRGRELAELVSAAPRRATRSRSPRRSSNCFRAPDPHHLFSAIMPCELSPWSNPHLVHDHG